MHGPFDFNTSIPFKIKITENPPSFAFRPLIFKLQQEVLKFSDICVSWSSPKTDLETNFLKETHNLIKKVTFEPLINFKQNHNGSWKYFKGCNF